MKQVKKWKELTWDELANIGEILRGYDGVFRTTSSRRDK